MGKAPQYTFFQKRFTNAHQAHGKMLNIINHQGNGNQNHSEIPLHTHQMAITQKSRNHPGSGKDVEKLQPSNSAAGNVK